MQSDDSWEDKGVIYFSFDSKLVEMIVAHGRTLENAGQSWRLKPLGWLPRGGDLHAPGHNDFIGSAGNDRLACAGEVTLYARRHYLVATFPHRQSPPPPAPPRPPPPHFQRGLEITFQLSVMVFSYTWECPRKAIVVTCRRRILVGHASCVSRCTGQLSTS